MPSVARFNLTPVKSTALHHPERIELTEHGVEGDHRFLFMEQDGRRISGAAKAPLLGVRADHDVEADRLTLAFPDGSRVEGSAAAEGEGFAAVMYDRQVPAREVPGEIAEAMSRHVGRPIRLARVDPPETAGGRHRASIVSLASIDDLGRRGGVADMPDPRRFRMVIELEDCDPYEEEAWSGRRVRIGEAVVAVGDRVPRCVLTTMDPDTGRSDFPALEVLASYRTHEEGLVIGVYADVVEPGTVRLGDRAAPLDAAGPIWGGRSNSSRSSAGTAPVRPSRCRRSQAR